MNINKNMITTAFELPQNTIIESLGIVRGISVRSRSAIGTFAAGIQTLFGGNISIYTKLCEKTRQEAFDLMMLQAEQIGANAVIGLRYDANEISAGVTEVLVYGTAVIVKQNP